MQGYVLKTSYHNNQNLISMGIQKLPPGTYIVKLKSVQGDQLKNLFSKIQ